MRKLGDLAEAEGRRAALDGMRGAEDGVDQFQVVGGIRQRQQRRFHAVEELAALLEEDIMELRKVCHVVVPSRRAMVASRVSGSNGLTIQPVAPAARPSCLRSALASVVRINMGTKR